MTPIRYVCCCCLGAATSALSACHPPPAEHPGTANWSPLEEKPETADRPQQPPQQIPVVRWQDPPPGYVEIRGPNWAYVAIGLGVFAGVYAPPALISANLEGNAWTMQVPFVGPLMQMGAAVEHFQDQGGPGGGTFGYIGVGYYFVFLAALTTGQVGGVLLSTVGLFQQQPRWVRREHSLIDAPRLGMKLRFTGSAIQLSGQF
jgi:hypothetical protein